MLVEMPVVTTDRFQILNPIEVDSMVGEGIQNFHNLTLQVPENVADYRVRVEISPVNAPIQVDFWVVNETGFEMLTAIMNYGDVFKPEYPNKRPYDSVKAYAKETNVTSRRQFELGDFDHNGTYCLLLLNFVEATQTVSVNAEEQNFESYTRTLLERTQANMIVVGVVAAVGACLVMIKPRHLGKRARSLSASTKFSFFGSLCRHEGALGYANCVQSLARDQNREKPLVLRLFLGSLLFLSCILQVRFFRGRQH